MTGKLLTGKNMAEFLEIRHIIPVVIIPTKVLGAPQEAQTSVTAEAQRALLYDSSLEDKERVCTQWHWYGLLRLCSSWGQS